MSLSVFSRRLCVGDVWACRDTGVAYIVVCRSGALRRLVDGIGDYGYYCVSICCGADVPFTYETFVRVGTLWGDFGRWVCPDVLVDVTSGAIFKIPRSFFGIVNVRDRVWAALMLFGQTEWVRNEQLFLSVCYSGDVEMVDGPASGATCDMCFCDGGGGGGGALETVRFTFEFGGNRGECHTLCGDCARRVAACNAYAARWARGTALYALVALGDFVSGLGADYTKALKRLG